LLLEVIDSHVLLLLIDNNSLLFVNFFFFSRLVRNKKPLVYQSIPVYFLKELVVLDVVGPTNEISEPL